MSISKGDKVEIKCQGRTITGIVSSSSPNRTNWQFPKDSAPTFDLLWDLEVSTSSGPVYWKQEQDGGTVKKL